MELNKESNLSEVESGNYAFDKCDILIFFYILKLMVFLYARHGAAPMYYTSVVHINMAVYYFYFEKTHWLSFRASNVADRSF